MRFSFHVPDGGEHWTGRKRSLRSVDFREISVVSAWPAYPDTEIALRAIMAGAEAQRRHRVLIMRERGLWE